MDTTTQPGSTKLAVVKVVHTMIYIVMASATLYVFFCGLVGRRDLLLFFAVGAVGIEAAVFFANGMRCPLTSLAQKYGDHTGHVGDTLFPERCTRYTFRTFGALYATGLLLVGFRSLLA